MTGNVQVAVLPLASVAVQVTVVVPTGNVEPDGGVHTTAFGGSGQLSLAVGCGKVVTAPEAGGQVAAATEVTGDGQVIVGGVVSVTVTVNEQLGPAVVVQLTVVVPTAKQLPEGGLQVTMPQLPVVIGAG